MKKLLDREPTEEMIADIEADIKHAAEKFAAPSVKVDMEPVACITGMGGLAFSYQATYEPKSTSDLLYSHEQLAALQAENERLLKEVEELKTIRGNSVLVPSNKLADMQAQLAERDRVILEQQALIDNLSVKLSWDVPNQTDALEAALKAERIKTLEDAADHLDGFPIRVVACSSDTQNDCIAELRRMANELKEQP